MESTAPGGELVIYDFNADGEKPKWVAENDGVMGGVSKGTGKVEGGTLVFRGELSLENNGGFASLQTDEGKWDLSGSKSAKIRVKGDGRTYQFRVATDAMHRGSRIDYAADFETKDGEWIEVTVPFSAMKPVWRGEKLDGPELDTKDIRQVRILLADKKAGPFLLAVDWIKTAG